MLMNWVFRLEVEFEVMGTERVSFDSKYVHLGVTKGDFSSEKDDDFKMEELTSRTEENETLSFYISGNSSALLFLSFSLKLKLASVPISSLVLLLD